MWGVEADFAQLGVWDWAELPAAVAARCQAGPFEGTFDYIFYAPGKLGCTAVLEALGPSAQEKVYMEGDTLPNAWHMSDHLPVGASFVYQK